MANVARYHRRGIPKAQDPGFKLLTREQRTIVLCLSSILRIADGLDRSHFSVVKGLKVELGNPVRLHVAFRYDPELELWTCERRKKLFEKIFGCRVEFTPTPLATRHVA